MVYWPVYVCSNSVLSHRNLINRGEMNFSRFLFLVIWRLPWKIWKLQQNIWEVSTFDTIFRYLAHRFVNSLMFRANIDIGNIGQIIREVSIFANIARRTNSRIQESRKNYYYKSATKERWKFGNSNFPEKSQNQKFAKIWKHAKITRSTVCTCLFVCIQIVNLFLNKLT